MRVSGFRSIGVLEKQGIIVGTRHALLVEIVGEKINCPGLQAGDIRDKRLGALAQNEQNC